jgi:hypothetical protein
MFKHLNETFLCMTREARWLECDVISWPRGIAKDLYRVIAVVRYNI